jgi:hypothetical protein
MMEKRLNLGCKRNGVHEHTRHEFDEYYLRDRRACNRLGVKR